MEMKPTLVIPTGHETQQRKAASKRKLAEAMLARGMETQPNMTSWTQVLGQLAQAWAGKSMQRDADKTDSEVNNLIREDYTRKRGGFLTDAQTMQPMQLVEKYGGDPMLQDELEPYRKAVSSALTNREELTTFGGKMTRKGDVLNQYANDPNESVHVVNGVMVPNGPKIAAAVASQGKPLVDQNGNMLYQPTAPMPQVGLAAMPKTQFSEAKTVSAEEAITALRSRPEVAANFPMFMKQQGMRIAVKTQQEAMNFPSGTPLILPDGTEGEVP